MISFDSTNNLCMFARSLCEICASCCVGFLLDGGSCGVSIGSYDFHDDSVHNFDLVSFVHWNP